MGDWGIGADWLVGYWVARCLVQGRLAVWLSMARGLAGWLGGGLRITCWFGLNWLNVLLAMVP